MAKKRVDVSAEEEAALNEVDLTALAEEAAAAREGGGAAPSPRMTDAGWNDHVMAQFAEDELDADGHPKIDGLRRVARKLLGPLLRSEAEVVQPPTLFANGVQPAVVRYTVEFLWQRLEAGEEAPYRVIFSDAADVYHQNADPDFARFPTALASTRAEGRALRKALGLRKCAAEEKTSVPLDNPDGPIAKGQVDFLENLCRRNDISIAKLIRIGQRKLTRLTDATYKEGVGMCRYAGDLQRTGVPPELKGFDPNWRTA